MNPRDSMSCTENHLDGGIAQRSLGHEPQRQPRGPAGPRRPWSTLNEVWGMNPRDSWTAPANGGSAITDAQRSLGHEPQRQFVLSHRVLLWNHAAQRSLGHEPQRQSPARARKPPAAGPLNEVWGMNPRDSCCAARNGPPTSTTLNEVWGMNPRDRSATPEPPIPRLTAQRSLGHEPQRQGDRRQLCPGPDDRSTKSGA